MSDHKVTQRLKRKRNTTVTTRELTRNASQLSVSRRSVLELPKIINIKDEYFELQNRQEPIGKLEREMQLRKHHQRLDEI